MTDDDRLQQLLRLSLPPTANNGPKRDLWTPVVNGIQAPAERSWLDIGLLVAIAVLLAVFPECLWLLAYQL